ncbi:hypothetical protein BKA61DRAFT_75491 [Leptodontidium sp. MPI-SDFR-AT-0119]|nr:hypothetical protein BKA61DRAFT_75491 [Leptodontidium sp. MPI-SDFR-AT-0119]
MNSQLVLLAFLAAWLPDCTAWEEGTFSSCVWPCVTNFPTPDCDESRSGSWESCFCSNETLIAEFKSCVDSSSCADSEKIDAAELCSSTGPYATYSAHLSSQYDEINKWSTKGGSWSAYHSYWSTSGTHTWYDKGPWPTGTAGPWGSGSWPEDKCPGSDWPGWTSSGTWDKSDWDEEWTSWTSWTDCSTATTPVSTTVTSTVPTTSDVLLKSTSSSSTTASTAVAGSFVTSTPSASASVPPLLETSGASGLSDGRLSSLRFMAMSATLFGIFLGMVIMF